MFNHSWKQELLTIPNFLSLFRLLLIPVYIRMYRNATSDLDYYLTGTVLGLSCLTDFADGKIARQYNMVSNAGKLLDPLADKLTQLSLILSLLGVYRILYPVLVLFLIKETFQLVAMFIFAQKGKTLSGALLCGKLCTAILFVSLLILVLFPGIPPAAVLFIVLTDTAFLVYAFCGYIQAYFGNNAKLTDLGKE